MMATWPLPTLEVNFAAVEQPPAPPPTTTSLKLKIRIVPTVSFKYQGINLKKPL